LDKCVVIFNLSLSFSLLRKSSSPSATFPSPPRASIPPKPPKLHASQNDVVNDNNDEATNELLSLLVWIMQKKVKEAYPDSNKPTVDDMLIAIVTSRSRSKHPCVSLLKQIWHIYLFQFNPFGMGVRFCSFYSHSDFSISSCGSGVVSCYSHGWWQIHRVIIYVMFIFIFLFFLLCFSCNFGGHVSWSDWYILSFLCLFYCH